MGKDGHYCRGRLVDFVVSLPRLFWSGACTGRGDLCKCHVDIVLVLDEKVILTPKYKNRRSYIKTVKLSTLLRHKEKHKCSTSPYL